MDFIDRTFGRVQRRYQRWLHGSLNYLPVTLVFIVVILGSIYFLYGSAQSELAPQEDQGVVIIIPTSAPTATLQQKELYDAQTFKIFDSLPERDHVFQIEAPGLSLAGVTFKPWDQRRRDATTLQRVLQGELGVDAGQLVVAFQPPSLPGAQGLPVQFVLKTTQPFSQLNAVAQDFLTQARASGMFIFLDTDLKYDLPQTVVQIDRDKAAQLGLTMTAIGGAMTQMLGGGYVNYFSLDTVVQGDPAGGAAGPPQPGSVARLQRRHHQQHPDPAIDHCHHGDRDDSAESEPLPATQRRDDFRCGDAGGVAERGAAVFAGFGTARFAGGLFD